MYGKLCFFILVLCLSKDTIARESESCYAENSNPYPYVGIKTPYHYVHNGTGEPIVLANCKPLQIWLLCRHGTRYPNKNSILQMMTLTHFRDLIVNNHKTNNRGNLCDKDLQVLMNWELDPELKLTKAKYLSSQGEKDLISLGQRFRSKFPELFAKNTSENYEFKSTETERTIASMKSFIKGAFGDMFEANLEIIPDANNTLLRIYENCPTWANIRNKKEMESFINGPVMTKAIANISRRLGFAKNISKDDAFLLFDACRFERAWYLNNTSPWCAAFTDDEVRIFEYEEDLYHYYIVGPGRKMNKKLGCHPIRDMFDRFVKLENGEGINETKGVFYFTHSEMMMLFFTAMGIGRDAMPPTALNFREIDHRNWRTSLLVPFASNFVAIFYSCGSSETSYKVAFYLAENPLTLEGCENGVCDWVQLKKKLSTIAAKCRTRVC